MDGVLLASLLRIPHKGTYIIDDRSTIISTSLNPKEFELAHHVGKKLLLLGIRFAAVDMIEGFITDLNITSPGLLVEAEKIDNMNYAEKIVKKISNPI